MVLSSRNQHRDVRNDALAVRGKKQLLHFVFVALIGHDCGKHRRRKRQCWFNFDPRICGADGRPHWRNQSYREATQKKSPLGYRRKSIKLVEAIWAVTAYVNSSNVWSFCIRMTAVGISVDWISVS